MRYFIRKQNRVATSQLINEPEFETENEQETMLTDFRENSNQSLQVVSELFKLYIRNYTAGQ